MSAIAAWRLLHLDLAEPVPGLDHSAPHAGVTVMLWRRGVPLGRLDYLDAELPLPAEALSAAIPRAIASAVGDRLFGRGFAGLLPTRDWWDRPAPDLHAVLEHPDLPGALDRALALPEPPAEALSVVICTRDRPAQLARCLASLAPNLPWIGEVIVVDNGTQTDATRALVEGQPKTRHVAEPRPGLSIARNTGLRQARLPVVAFTDDDVAVHRDWAARLLAGFATPETACVTGLVLPTELETAAQVTFEHGLGGFGQGLQRITYDQAFFQGSIGYGVPVWRIGAGANMAMRRDVLLELGGFDERLGAGAAGCSEDSELWYRMLAAGWTCRYDPAAVVFHEHRRDWAALRRQAHDYMRGHVAALILQYARHGHVGNLQRLALTIPGHYLRILLDAALRRDRFGRARLAGTELHGALRGLAALRWDFPRTGPRRRTTEAAP